MRWAGNDGFLVIRNRVNSFYSSGSSVATVGICCFPAAVLLFTRYIIPKHLNFYFS